MEIIDVIKNKPLKEVTLIEYIKAIQDLDYLVMQLQTFIDEYYDIIVKHQVPPFIHNCILESTLLNIRKLYEFFFYFEIKVRKDNNGKIQDKQKWPIHNDVFAEYFFHNIEDWYNLKLKHNFDYKSFNNKISKTLDLDLRAIHFTFSKKNNWKDIIPIIPELINIYDIFKKNNMFDKNKRPNSDKYELELFRLINDNFHTGNIEENEENEDDKKINDLTEKVYFRERIHKLMEGNI